MGNLIKMGNKIVPFPASSPGLFPQKMGGAGKKALGTRSFLFNYSG